jgi:hypothetical protein
MSDRDKNIVREAKSAREEKSLNEREREREREAKKKKICQRDRMTPYFQIICINLCLGLFIELIT